MPVLNRFQHQQYPTIPALLPVLKTLRHTDAGEANFREQTDRLSIRRVLLVHGTFVGDDPFGIADVLRGVSGSFPLVTSRLNTLAETIEDATRPLTSRMLKDVANYCPEYRDGFEQLTGTEVSLLDPTWSSQNHPLARAELAVRLLCDLDALSPAEDDRIMLWGHSHAGQGFAILTNLLANDRDSVERFFETVDQPSEEYWQQARELLAKAPTPHPLAKHLILVTFGTPVRYGWDTTGCNGLVHVIHHRPYDPDSPYLTRPLFPPHSISEFLTARYGDWVQAFAIAGTDFTHLPAPATNQKLRDFLESGLAAPAQSADTRLIFPKAIRDLCARWKTGCRCHTDGHNLLLDYEPCGRINTLNRPIEESVFGHGVATTVDWLPAHLSLILDTLSRTVDE